MTVLIKELRDALVEAGASDEKADAAAAAVVPIQHLDNLATKQDLAELRLAAQADLAELKAELMWRMAGLLIAQAAAIVALIKLIP